MTTATRKVESCEVQKVDFFSATCRRFPQEMDMILKAETLPEDIAFFAKLLNVSVSDFNEYCILNLQKSNIFLVIL